MGCASSRPVRHNSARLHGSHSPHTHSEQAWKCPDMFPVDSHHHGHDFMPQAPLPVACSHRRNPYAYPSPMTRREGPVRSRNQHESRGQSARDTKSQSQSQSQAERGRARAVSPPRHRNEMPRRHPSHRYRDVSPLGSSRFEQPFERAYVRGARWEVVPMQANFQGGIGEWEVW